MVKGTPITPGFKAIRQVADAIGIVLVLDTGEVARGDALGVAFSGRMDRDTVLAPEEQLAVFERDIAPQLEGAQLSVWRPLAERFDQLTIGGRRIHTTLRYGISQALLAAVALGQRKTMAEVVAREWGLSVSRSAIPLNLQVASDYYAGVDKVILLRGPYIHTYSVYNMEIFRQQPEYVAYLRKRLTEYTEPEYRPTIHMDCYGHVGYAFDADVPKMVEYLARLEELASPYRLLIEDPVNMGQKPAQIEKMAQLHAAVHDAGLRMELLADELCPRLEDHKEFAAAHAADYQKIKAPDLGSLANSVDGLLHLKKMGVKTYLSGSATSTIQAANCLCHIAMAVQPDQLLAVPGGGVNEAYSLMFNEMRSIMALTA
jgi:methylaspartate ammonia-lyase